MLKTTFADPRVFDLEFEGHGVGMSRRNLAPENANHGLAYDD